MHSVLPRSNPPRLPVRQRGQALIYGIVMVLGAAVATFFVFNTGQLTAEKTKLVNTADAVAYSAGVMHARALNFDAYTNRALLANEATIAQMVSISSWLEYAQGHVEGVPPLNCYTPQYSVPAVLGTFKYLPLCVALATTIGAAVVEDTDAAFNGSDAGALAVAAAEAAKTELKTMQATMFAGFLFARSALAQEVAEANYRNDGSVSVDALPLKDGWTAFEGGPFISLHTGDERQRMRDTIVEVIGRDDFVRDRSWTDDSPLPCLPAPGKGRASRTGGTQLDGYDAYEAKDHAHYEVRQLRFHFPFRFSCDTVTDYQLGSGTRRTSSTPGEAWYYSGVPDFYELSDAALAYTPSNTDPDKHDPRLQFAIRVTRDVAQTRTSAGTSAVKPSGRLQVFASAAAGNVLAAVATSEVYFDHQRDDGTSELGSLFNPYWQVHLISNPPAVTAAALALQGAAP
jgi:hypothetical protein